MRGIVKESPTLGAVLKTDLPIPEIKDDEVLVKVHATAICGTDIHIYEWTEFAQKRLTLPMVFGHEFSGEIVKVGSVVSHYKIGDRVAGETHIPCNNCIQCKTGNQHICENMKIIGVHTAGCFSEYISVHMDCLWRLNDSMDYKTGAMLEPMGVGVHGVLSGEIGGMDTVILGCGPIGLCAIGTARACGANRVFAVDIIEGKFPAAKKMGADYTINSIKEDVIKVVMEATNGRGADVVVDYTGNANAIHTGFKVLAKGGRFTFVGLANGSIALELNDDIIYKEAVINGVTGRLMYKTWYQCDKLLQSGKFDMSPVIGGEYALEEYEKAFAAIKSGAPGKMLLIP